MLTVLILTLVIALAYLGISIKVSGGIPVSLSDTYYKLGNRKWLFQVAMAFVAVTLYPVWFSASSEELIGLAFASCASLLFVASAPCFREELQGKVHYSAAVVCCVSVFLWQILEGLWDVTLWFVFLAGMLTLHDKNKWCWWLECAAIGSLLANLWRLI